MAAHDPRNHTKLHEEELVLLRVSWWIVLYSITIASGSVQRYLYSRNISPSDKVDGLEQLIKNTPPLPRPLIHKF